MLECRNLVKSYRRLDAVNHMDLKLEPGKIYAFLGPNGSGKTTFMKMAAGLVKPTSGTITFHGEPVGVQSKKHIAYMPTEAYFYPYMTAKDVGKYYKDFFEDFRPAYYNRFLRSMDLDPSQKVSKMSSGMMAKLKIAVTLSRDAQLTMLDEPLNGIDIIAIDQVISAISSSFSPEKTFLLSSHLVDELERIIDHALFIRKGELVLQGEAHQLHQMSGKSLADLYREIYGQEGRVYA